MKSVSFIVPSYNAESTVGKTVKSILSQKYKGKFEVIVIDDKSKDSSLKILSKFKKNKNFRLIINENNLGLGKSLNKAISLSKYDLLAIVWCDFVLINNNWLDKMVKMFESDDKIACVMSDLFLPKEIWQKYTFWDKVNTLDEYLRGIKKIKFEKLTLFDKDKVKEFGVYDTNNFRIAGEDTDLRLKLIKKGYKIVMSDARIMHLHGFYKLTFLDRMFKKALPLAEASGVLFRKHFYLESSYRNAITYTIIYLLAITPTFIQPLFLTILILMLAIYTLNVLRYINDVKVIFVPFYKFFKDIISLIGFWKGFITKKQEF